MATTKGNRVRALTVTTKYDGFGLINIVQPKLTTFLMDFGFDPDTLDWQGAGQSKQETGGTNNSGNHGVVNYNYYNTHYQNSMDLSSFGGDKHQQNYGHEGGTTNSAVQNNKTNLLQAGLSAMTQLLPLLADSKTETYQNSDRVQVDEAGNTSLVSQSAVGRRIVSKPKPKFNVSSAADMESDGGPSTDRYYPIPLKTPWSTALVQGNFWRIPLPQGLRETSGVFGQMAARHCLLKCGYDVVVMVNSTRFHGGALGVFMIPEFTQKGNCNNFDIVEEGTTYTLDGTIPFQQLFLYPHQIINPRTNSSVTLSVPYCNFAPGTDVTTHVTWTILIAVLSRLTVSEGGTPNLTIQVNVRPTDAVFHGLRYASAFQGPIPIKLTQNSYQWVTTTPGSSDPVYGPCVGPTADFIPLEITDILQLTSIPTLCGPVQDELTAEFGIVKLLADHKKVKYTVDVSLSSRFVVNTSLEAFTRGFAQYRGGINIEMVFVGNQMQNTRYMLCYTPPGVTPPQTQEEAMNCEYIIYDTGINTRCKFTVPYISTTDFRYTNSGEPNDVTVAGYVSFFQLTGLAVPPGSPPTADLLIFASSAEDFRVKHYAHSNIKYQGEPVGPGETGVSDSKDETLQETSPVPIPPSNSSISFMADRWCLMNVFKVERSGTKVELTLQQLEKYSTMLSDLGVLYIRADLEIGLKVVNTDALSGNSAIYAAFYPPGSVVNNSNTQFTGNGDNNITLPSFLLDPGIPNIKLTGDWTNFSVPYTSALSALPFRYSGYSNYTGKLYGIPPAATWGTLLLTATSNTHQVIIYFRLKNTRGWVPRPKAFTPPPSRGRYKDENLVCATGADNYSLLKLCGDVEENPGPGIFSKLNSLNKLSELIPNEKDMDKLVNWVKTLQEKWEALTSDAGELVWKIVKWFVMVMCACKAGIWGKILLAFHCGGKFLKHLFSIVTTYFKGKFKTSPPEISKKALQVAKDYLNKHRPYQDKEEDWPKPPEFDEKGYCEDLNPFSEKNTTWFEKIIDMFRPKFQGPLQDLASIGTVLRHGEWLIKMINYFVGWLKTWIKRERDSGYAAFCDDYQKIPEVMSTIKKKPKHSNEWQEARSWLADVKLRAEKLGVEAEFRLPEVPEQPSNVRPEPVVIVLRGAPGQGKSVAAVLLAQQVSHRLGGNGQFFGYSAATKHFDGYTGQPVVVFDDAGQCTDGVDFTFFCQMVSAAPWTPPMADLSQKGILFSSPVIIMTTNMADFRPNTLADHNAIDRRLTMELDVRANICRRTKNGSVLDLPKALDGLPEQWAIWTNAITFTQRLEGGRALNSTTKTVTLKKLIDMTVEEVEKKMMIADKLLLTQPVNLNQLSFQGPCDPAPKPIPAPRRKDVEKKKFDWLKALDVATQVVTILTMLLTGFSLLKMVFQGPYDGQPTRSKQTGRKKVEVIDLRYEGPYCQDLELSVRRKNMLVVNCKRYDGREFQTNMLGLKGRLVLWNFHLFDQAKEIKIDDNWIDLSDLRSQRIASDGRETDLVVTELPKGRPFQDLRKHLTDDTPRYGAQILGVAKSLDISFSGTLTGHRDSVTLSGMRRTFDVYAYKSNTGPGYCGAPIFAQVGNSRHIIGMHCAGGNEVGMASRITRTMANIIIESFDPPEYQGLIKDEERHPLVYTPSKTSFYPTPAHDEYTTVQPAVLSPYDSRLDPDIDFNKAIFKKHTGNINTTPSWMIDGARIYAEIIRSKCGPVSQSLTLGEAIRGIEGLDPIDMDKSPGLPYVLAGQRRQDILVDKGEKIQMDTILYSELLNFLSGNFSNHKFLTFLKDELRPDEKIRNGATRTVDIASTGHMIVGRMLFGRLASQMHLNPGVELGSALGCDPDVDWTRFAVELGNQYYLDMDYSGFDSTHGVGSFEALKIFLKELGFDDVALAYVDSLAVSRHVYRDREFTLEGGLPSGCACTSIFNTIMNNIIIRGLTNHLGYEVKMLAYGDDVIVSAPEPFDFCDYKRHLEETTGYKVTTADKNDLFAWHTSIEGVQFLKRGFQQEGTLYKPVMKCTHLHNILSYARAGTLQEKLTSVAGLAVHCTRDQYYDLFEPFINTGFVVPSYLMLKDNWLWKNGVA
nr:MAG: putative polyprotein [Picornavirales sp.]